MTISIGSVAGEVHQALAVQGIANFSTETIKEVESFIGTLEREAPNGDPSFYSLRMADAYLSAAEFALLPAFIEPGTIAAGGPLDVTPAHARLSLLKGDCTLTGGAHRPYGTEVERWDLMVFAGDVSKTTLLLPDWTELHKGPQVLYPLVEQLVELYQSSATQAGRSVDPYFIRLEGLLWRVKLAVLGHPGFETTPEQAVREAKDALHIA